MTAARDAERLKAWTLAPQVHPLLLHQGRSPLEWVAEGLQGTLDLGMIFYRESGDEGIAAWEPGRTWIAGR